MRSAEFDREQVLRAAIKAFICKGYNKTSMQDLKRATGLHPGSIYCAFGNKQGLLLASLDQYNQDKAAEFSHYFDDKDKVLDGVKQYLQCTVDDCTSGGPQKFCLTQKALNELAEQEPGITEHISGNMLSWQDGFIRAFENALKNGELSADRSAVDRAQSFIMGILGLRSFAQNFPEPSAIQKLADQLYLDVCR